MKTTRHTATLPRRDFLKGILAAGSFSIITPGLLFSDERQAAAKPAGQKVKLACIGIGNQGWVDIKRLHETGLAEIVALCDTDMGAEQTRKALELCPNVPRFQDFRRMFDKMEKQIEAVLICTPDFSHFPATILAMSLGKHVYVEKPMAHTFREIDLLMAAEKKYKVAAQMGNQGHSGANYFQFKAWTEAGIIKNVTRIDAYMNSNRRWHDSVALKKYNYALSQITGFLPAQTIPETLDWDTWLSSGRFYDYNIGYTGGEWRSWYEFGNGALGDWGAHIFDTAHRFLDLGLPEEVDAVKLDGYNPFIFPQASTLAFRFPKRGDKPPCTLNWYDGVNNKPPLPPEQPATTAEGEPIKFSPGKFIYGENLTFRGDSHASMLRIIPAQKARELALAKALPNVPKSPSDHYQNFLLACMGREQCRSSFAIAGPLCQTMALGVIAQRLNAKLKFSRKDRQFTNNTLANQLLDGRPPRKGWEQFYKL